MPKTEQYTGAIKCKCGQSGTATYEENENPVHHQGRLDTRLIMVSEGFSIRAGKAFCDSCGSELNTDA